MSWSNPLTWVVGQLVTAAQLNTHLRDNLQYLYDNAGGGPGSVIDFAGAAAPTGWLVCDGAAVSRTTYAALFAAIGTAWGVGDGSTTFNLPDLRGRVTVGVGTGASLTPRALAATGGEETHVLSVPEMPIHGHTLGGSLFGTTYTTGGSGSVQLHLTTGSQSTSNAGSGTAHENMQPWRALNKIIKT